MRVALDTNVLAYAAGVEKALADAPKVETSHRLILALSKSCEPVIPTQVVGELYNVLRRYFHNDAMALSVVSRVQGEFVIAAYAPESLDRALRLATDHKLQIWDALILATASEAGCALLLSEDLQHRFEWGGVMVLNPFAEKLDRRLAKLVQQ